MSPIELILSRLDKPLRRADGGWMVKCCAHEDRSPSLSITEGIDGRVLLHCFAGCSALDILDALSLTVADLFPEPITDHEPVRGKRHRHNPFDLLRILTHEADLVATAAASMLDGIELSPADFDRLLQARQKIALCRAAV